MAEDWTEHFQGLRNLPQQVRQELVARSHIIKADAGDKIFSPGMVPDNLLMLLEGSVRVSQTSELGREIVLYRVSAGESCVLTTACIFAEEAYAAEGIVETPMTAAAVPRAVFNDLVAEHPVFRDFVFSAYSRRLIDLMRVIDEVAFGKIDTRLAARLVALADGEGVLHGTHQQLATELGTAREVVSRQLNEFQRRGWISSTRGHIKILDAPALQSLAEAH